MSLPDPNRYLFPNRRSKKLSLDGRVPGVHYGRHLRGAGYADGGNLAGRVPLPEGTPAKEYDPVRAEYPTAPGYDPPDPWDAIELEPRTPPIRIEFPHRLPRAVQYRDARMTEAFFDAVLDRFADRPQLQAISEQIPIDHNVRVTQPLTMDEAMAIEDQPRTGPEPIMDDVMTIPSSALVATEAEVALAIDDAISLVPETESPVALGAPADIPMPDLDSMAPEPLDAMPDPFAMTLDTLVEQMMPEPAMPQPEEPDPYLLMNQAFDQQMHMMDPFNMMGPMG